MSWRAQISRCVQEFRFVACTTSDSSIGLRQYFRSNYRELKMLNPLMDFVYREADGMEPFVYARFDWGEERQIYVPNKSPQEVEKVIKELVELGATLPKSPESDVILANPVIDAFGDEDDYDNINLTYDGKSPRVFKQWTDIIRKVDPEEEKKALAE